MSSSGLSFKESNRVVVRMKNTSGGSLAAGDVVIIKSVAAGDEVTTTTTAGDSKVFGMAIEAISNDAYGRILTKGFTTALKVDGTDDIAIGDFLSAFTTAKIAQKVADGETAFAIALEAYTTNDSSGVIDAVLIEPRIATVAAAGSDNGGKILYKTDTNVSLSDINETTLFSFTLAANTLGTDGGVRMWIPITALSAGSSATQVARLKYGTTTIATATITGTVSESGGFLEAYLLGNGATDSQFGWLTFGGSHGSGSQSHMVTASGTSAENSTGALTLTVTAQRSSNAAGNAFNITGAIAIQLV